MTARLVSFPRWLFPLAVLLLTIVPIVELMLLVALSHEVGLVPTFAVCAATGFLGAWLARWQGARTWLAAQTALAEGRFPAEQVADGALLLVGGVVLLTPGLLTDALGFVLLVPPSRRLVKAVLRRWWERRSATVSRSASGDDILDAEVIDDEGDPR